MDSGTSNVQYGYDSGNGCRLANMTYPNGRVLLYEYAGVDDTIGRVSDLADQSTGQDVEQYLYLGLGTIVSLVRPECGVNLTYIGTSNGEAGDKYVGLDRFGRVIDQKWATSAGAVKDEYGYGYDADGNVMYRNNTQNPALGELYHTNSTGQYDLYNRLTDFQRGTLSTGKDAVTAPSTSTNWNLDSLGNWNSVAVTVGQNTTTTNRTNNGQNQITSQGMTYDANGNTTTDETGRKFVYDAWNRMVIVKDAGNTTIMTYKWDSMGRLIDQNGLQFYYSKDSQILQDFKGTVKRQYVWGLAYVDEMVLRDRDAAAGGNLGIANSGLDERLYVLQDANWNVTALVSQSGAVQERYLYDPYGNLTIMDKDSAWTPKVGSGYNWTYFFQGGRYDGVPGVYYFRNRMYSPTTGRWMQQDPAGYVDGGSLYQYERSGPVGRVDPSGCDTRDTSYDYGGHLTFDQAKKLRSALLFYLVDAGAATTFLFGSWDRSLTVSFMRRYLGGSGRDQSLRYSTIRDTDLIRRSNAKATEKAFSGLRHWETGDDFSGDLGTSLGGVTIYYTFEDLTPHVQPTGGCRLQRFIVHGRIHDLYDFHPGGRPGEKNANVNFPYISLNFEGCLAGWRGGSDIPDRWMADLEDYGLARSFYTTIEWQFAVERRVEAGK